MSAVEAPKVADAPQAGHVESAPAPVAVEPVVIDKPVEPVVDAPKTETEVTAPATETKEEKTEVKPVEPKYEGSLGYKAPGLKNAFRFSKKFFWFGEEAVPHANLREYLRGEKPEVAHPVAAWSSTTGKGLVYFVKHADQKEHPAGVLNLAYATDLVKDGADAFSLKISGHKHTFEAASAAERDSWFVAFEKAITDAKEAKEGVESSESYKEHKEKISKPTALAAAATASTPKKSTDATPALATTEAAPATEEAVVAAPARTGSASSSSDEENKAKKAKSKSRSASRKRASIFGGLLGKKDKAEEKKVEEKEDKEAAKTEPEVKTDEAVVAPVAADATTTAPVITSDIPAVGEELKTEAAPVAAIPVEETKTAETPVKAAETEKPKPTKRTSIFGSVFNKLSSPTSEKKEGEAFPTPATKVAEPTAEASKPLEEAVVAVPATTETVSEPTAPKTEEVKAADDKPAVSTPGKEKEHFSFGRFFGSKDRAKSPAATDKALPAEPAKVDAVAPRIEDPVAPVVAEPVVAAPAVETEAGAEEKKEETVAKEEAKKTETPAKKEKRSSIFATLGRSLSKTGKAKEPKEKKDAVVPTTVAEGAEPKDDKVVAEDKKEETPIVADAAVPAEKTVGDVVPEAVTVGEAPKSAPAVSTTA